MSGGGLPDRVDGARPGTDQGGAFPRVIVVVPAVDARSRPGW